MLPDIYRDPVARLHLMGMWVNALGGGIFSIALPLIVLTTTGSLSDMAWLVVAGSIPKVFPGILIGSLADRHPPRAMMLVGYLGQALTVGVAPVLLALDGSLWILVLTAFMRGSFDMIARTAGFAAIPAMYGERTPQFNAALSTAWTSANIIGPAVGGFAVALADPRWFLLVDALSFIVIGVTCLFLPLPRTAAGAVGGDEDPGWWASVREGWAYLAAREGFVRFLVSVATSGAVVAPLAILAQYTVSQVLHEPASIVGIVSAAAALGLFLGSVAANRDAHRAPQTIMRRGAAVFTLGLLLVLLPWWVTMALSLVIVFAGGIYWSVGRASLIHAQVDKRHLGLSMATTQAVETVVNPASVVLATATANRLGPTAAFVILIVTGAVSWLSVATPTMLLAGGAHDGSEVDAADLAGV